MKKNRLLAKGEVEITWTNGSTEIIAVKGVFFWIGAIALDYGDSKVVIPWASIRQVRVLELP